MPRQQRWQLGPPPQRDQAPQTSGTIEPYPGCQLGGIPRTDQHCAGEKTDCLLSILWLLNHFTGGKHQLIICISFWQLATFRKTYKRSNMRILDSFYAYLFHWLVYIIRAPSMSHSEQTINHRMTMMLWFHTGWSHYGTLPSDQI